MDELVGPDRVQRSDADDPLRVQASLLVEPGAGLKASKGFRPSHGGHHGVEPQKTTCGALVASHGLTIKPTMALGQCTAQASCSLRSYRTKHTVLPYLSDLSVICVQGLLHAFNKVCLCSIMSFHPRNTFQTGHSHAFVLMVRQSRLDDALGDIGIDLQKLTGPVCDISL